MLFYTVKERYFDKKNVKERFLKVGFSNIRDQEKHKDFIKSASARI